MDTSIKEYLCYTITIDKTKKAELTIFVEETFPEHSYEILNDDIEKTELSNQFGEIYESVLTDSKELSIRFYFDPLKEDETNLLLKNLPEQATISMKKIEFSEKQVLAAYKEKIMLTETCVIIFDETDLSTDEKLHQIIIPARNAFGTGSHTTTRLAARLLEELVNKQTTLIDVGTGTGVLAMYAAKLGARAILAIDSDMFAIIEAQELVQVNNVLDNIVLKQNSFLEGINLNEYSLIVANLSLDLYKLFLPTLVNRIHVGQMFVFSGISDSEAVIFEEMLAKYRLNVEKTLKEEEWIAYYVKRIK